MSRRAGPAGTRTSTSPIQMRWPPNSRHAMSSFLNHSKTTMMVCVDSSSRTPTDTCCFSGVLVPDADDSQSQEDQEFQNRGGVRGLAVQKPRAGDGALAEDPQERLGASDCDRRAGAGCGALLGMD